VETSLRSTDLRPQVVRACGITFDSTRIKSPALRRIVHELMNGDEAHLVSCRHKDWSQQAQCGCVMGCLGG
jgi:hypothetical protein